MSATSVPIPPDIFARALEPLELPQLFAERARLFNSIHHLERSNVALEAAAEEDEECRIAVEENLVVIARQRERIRIIELETEKRGSGVVCGEGSAERSLANSVNGAEVNGHVEQGERGGVEGSGGGERGERGVAEQPREQPSGEEEEEGVYL